MNRVIYMTNIGTIPDETSIIVKIGDQPIGNISEGFLERLKRGDIFVLGGDTYEFKFARGMVAQVGSSSGRPPTVPRWVSEMLPLSFDLANEIIKFRELMRDKLKNNKKSTKKEVLKFINDYLYVDTNTANSLYSYFKEQYDYAVIPSTREFLVETFFDEERNSKMIVFHSLFGRKVNDCLSRALAFAISKQQKRDVEVGINDNGFYIISPEPVNIVKTFSLLKAEDLNEIMEIAIAQSEVLKRRFRHCAARALMILRNYKGRTKRVGRQQVSSMILISAVRRISEEFSILKESKREVLQDLMDIINTKLVLEKINKKTIKIKEIETKIPSPFAFNIVLQGYLDILKMEDKHEFLKRMHQIVLAKIALKKGKKGESVDFDFDMENIDPYSKFKEAMKKHKKKLNKKQQVLANQLSKIKRLPVSAKTEILNWIRGERVENYEVAYKVKQYEEEIIKNWPKNIAHFVIKKSKDETFSYDEMWSEEEEQKELDKELELEKISLNFNKNARKLELDPQIKYDIQRIIEGETKGIKRETILWIKGLLEGTIHKIWNDETVRFFKKKLKEID